MSKVKTPESIPTPGNVKPTAEAPKASMFNAKPKSFQGLPFLFDKQNYVLMAIGLVVIIVGYIMMSGGRSADPNVFDADALYSFRRITLAPILVLVGLAIEGYAIMKKPSDKSSSN